MSLPDDYEIIRTTSTDATVKVYVPWTFDGVDDLNVWYQNTVTGVVYYSNLGDFTVTTGEDGGGVFVNIENTQGVDPIDVAVARETPKTQTYSLNEAEALNPVSLIEALDKAIKLLQEVALGYDEQSLTSINPYAVPDKVTRAGKFQAFDVNGDPTYQTIDEALQDPVDWATEWAKKAEDVLISLAAGGNGTTDYSSLHHAAKSAASAAAAVISADAALDSENNASTSESNAASSASAAAASEANVIAIELSLKSEGILPWDLLVDYPVDGYTKGSDGSLYKSLQTPNLNQDPVSTPAYWEAAGSSGGGGILPSGNTSMGDADYTVLAGDVGFRVDLPAGATADRVATMDVSLLADDTKQISFINKSDYRLEIVVSNTGTMTFNNSRTNFYLWKGDGILTLNGDTATNNDIVAGG